MEVTSVLAAAPGLRLEHLASHGQASHPDFWYDQPKDEWVALLRGSATVVFDEEHDACAREETRLELAAGDSLTIPAHVKHRVERVSRDAIWIALHFLARPRSEEESVKPPKSPETPQPGDANPSMLPS